MPIYEYQCGSCGHVVEKMMKITDPPPAVCSSCKVEGKMAKLISRSSFQLKGGGWYSEGYNTPAPDKAAASSGDSSAPSSGDSSAPSSGDSSAPSSSDSPSSPKPKPGGST